MSSKRIEIFKKASNFLKISLNATHSRKKSLAAIAALPQWPVRSFFHIFFGGKYLKIPENPTFHGK
jgi:hypothetical protein